MTLDKDQKHTDSPAAEAEAEDRYEVLAPYYDELQGQINHAEWAAWLDRLARETPGVLEDPQGTEGRPLWLDLGCGTGSMLLELHKLNYDLIGIDGSEAMLAKAREKVWSAGLGTDILLLEQDLTSFELFGTVNVCSILLDTVNHLPDLASFRQVLALCHNYLHPGGLLIFDVVTENHARERLGNQQFFVLEDRYALFWEHSYEETQKISRAELTLFEQDQRLPGLYKRRESVIEERIFTGREIISLLDEIGFKDIRSSELLGAAADETSSRVFYLARK